SHGLLMDHSMFEGQRAAFEGRYRVIAYDHRGQGQSRNADNDAGQVLDMETLTGDAAALIQALDAAPCHFAGLSMGGFIGFRLALTPFCPGAPPTANKPGTGPGTGPRPPAFLVSGQPGLDRWRKAIHGHRHESPIWRDHATGSSPAPYARGVAGETAA